MVHTALSHKCLLDKIVLLSSRKQFIDSHPLGGKGGVEVGRGGSGVNEYMNKWRGGTQHPNIATMALDNDNIEEDW